MMSHTKVSDLLGSRDHRVLSGFRLRRGVRPGGHVLDLYRGLPGRRTGCGTDRNTGTFVAGPSESPIRQEKLIFANFDASKKLTVSVRVEVKKHTCVAELKHQCRIVVAMPKQFGDRTLHVVRRERLLSAERLPAASTQPLRGSNGIPESLQTTELLAAVCAPPVADAGSLLGMRPSHSEAFCRPLRTHAAAGLISTGASHTKTEGAGDRTSAIVLVTTLGTVTASLQMTPRG